MRQVGVMKLADGAVRQTGKPGYLKEGGQALCRSRLSQTAADSLAHARACWGETPRRPQVETMRRATQLRPRLDIARDRASLARDRCVGVGPALLVR
jgi:hypothetical protein